MKRQKKTTDFFQKKLNRPASRQSGRYFSQRAGAGAFAALPLFATPLHLQLPESTQARILSSDKRGRNRSA
jgi:hypothetical protein